jgi:hypothetical protein
VVAARQLDEPGARDPLGHVASLVDVHVDVIRAVDQDRRHLDRGQDLADVDLRVHAQQGGGGLWARGLAQVSADPSLEGLVVRLARGERPEHVGRTPPGLGLLDLLLAIHGYRGPGIVVGTDALGITPDERQG